MSSLPPDSISMLSAMVTNPSFSTLMPMLAGNHRNGDRLEAARLADLDFAFFVEHLHHGIGLIDFHDQRAVFGPQR